MKVKCVTNKEMSLKTNENMVASTNLGGDWRLNSIDKLKIFCAFLIVCIHAPFHGVIGEYFTALTRIAVPIFFMITGYFYTVSLASRQIRKLLKLVLIGNGIYLLWKLALAVMKGEAVSFLTSIFTGKNMAKFFLFNDTHLQSHLWYLGAILYVVVIVTAIIRWNDHKGRSVLYLIVPILLLGDLVLGKYSLAIFRREFPYFLVRNWLFVGIPYFSIGMWLKERELKIRKWKLIGLIVLTVLTTLLERYILVSSSLNPTRDHYLSTTFLAIFVFLFFLHYVGDTENIVSQIGKRDSAWIYILHPIVITVLAVVMKKIGVENIYNIVRPIIVFLITTVVVDLMIMASKKTRSERT